MPDPAESDKEDNKERGTDASAATTEEEGEEEAEDTRADGSGASGESMPFCYVKDWFDDSLSDFSDASDTALLPVSTGSGSGPKKRLRLKAVVRLQARVQQAEARLLPKKPRTADSAPGSSPPAMKPPTTRLPGSKRTILVSVGTLIKFSKATATALPGSTAGLQGTAIGTDERPLVKAAAMQVEAQQAAQSQPEKEHTAKAHEDAAAKSRDEPAAQATTNVVAVEARVENFHEENVNRERRMKRAQDPAAQAGTGKCADGNDTSAGEVTGQGAPASQGLVAGSEATIDAPPAVG